MKTIPLEEALPCRVLALLVLVLFYGIYFGKAMVQKRKGIQTRQIGRRKEKNIHTVELLMSSTRRLGQCGKKEASPASVMLVCLLLMGREAPTQPAASGGSRSAARAARALRRSWRECS